MVNKKAKIFKVDEETRRETLQRGIKHGSIQNTIDKSLDKFGDPLSGKAVDLFKKLHPNADIAAPAVDTFVKSSILAGLAEIMGAAHMVGGKIPGFKKIDEGKYKALAGYLRSYAGQRTGTKTADSMFELAPMLLEAFSNPALKELLGSVDEEDSAGEAVKKTSALAPAKAAVNADKAIKRLSDDDE